MMIFPRLQGVNRTATKLAGVAVVMVSLSFAAVPFYNWFCRVTGFGGTTGVATAPSAVVLERTIKVRFDASLERGMPWQFKPEQREITLRIGETGQAYFEAYNPTDRVIAGRASYNVTPDASGRFFKKIACFCFEMQVLKPGERVRMPVTFYVDPGLVTDAEGRFVKEITLSYTMHEIAVPEEQAALAPVASAPVN